MESLTAERLRELLDYDPVSGIFAWRRKMNRRWKPAGPWIAGTPKNTGYLQIRIDGKFQYAHRLAWLYMTDTWPTAEIDHRNRIRDDNRFANLREATRADNAKNSSIHRKSKTGVRGVYFETRTGKYYVQIKCGGTITHVGTFPSIEAAREARNLAVSKFHGNFANYS